MPINYSVVKNNLKPDNPRYRAQVLKRGTLNLNDIIEAISQPGTGITPAETIGVITRLQEVITDSLLDGYTINLPFANFGIGIRGDFKSQEDVFCHKRHKVVPYAEAGQELIDAFQSVATHKKPYRIKTPVLIHIHDTSSDLFNSVLTPNGIAKVTGTNLKFDPNDEQQGIFLKGSNGTIRIHLVPSILQTELIFQVPENLPEGEYHLEVKSIPLHAGEVRSGALNNLLVVRKV
jgi:hypothetical protein